MKAERRKDFMWNVFMQNKDMQNFGFLVYLKR